MIDHSAVTHHSAVTITASSGDSGSPAGRCAPFRLVRAGALIALGVGGLSGAAWSQEQGTTATQGLFDNGSVAFSAAQAARGRSAYNDNCSSCHGGNLDDGQFGPPVKGPAFRAQWHNQTPEALLTFVATKMPPSAPYSLDNQTYADIDAYLLQQNGEPAGKTELTAATVAAAAPKARPADKGSQSGRRGSVPGPFRAFGNQDATYKAVIAHRQALLAKLTPVSAQMLAHPPAGDWLMYRGDYGSLGYSHLKQIDRTNAADLGVAWSLTLPISANEITPLVHDGVLFIESGNTVEALDGTSGDMLWQYIRRLPDGLHNGRDARMKTLAIYQRKLYAPTADGHIVALDMQSGRLIWDEPVLTPAQGMHEGEVDGVAYHISGGPIVAHGKVIVGVSLGTNTAGGDFIVGLDGQTGKELWRFHTIARPGQPGGDSWNGAPVNQRYGGGVWNVGSYDPDLNQVYFGTGNTYDVGTLLLPHGQKGESNDALYTDSTLALNPDTGKLVWYYQHMNRDVWDLDWVFEQTLLTLPVDGKPTKLLVTGGKLGIFDALDRADGKYEFSKDAGLQNLVVRIDPETGRKIVDPKFENPQPGRKDLICPGTSGARSWTTTAFDPSTDLLYVPLLENCMEYTFTARDAASVAAGGVDIRGTTRPAPGSDGKFGRIEAIDLKTRQIAWTVRQRAPISSSMLASAGGVLFGGSHDRAFHAYDAASGKLLWETTLNSAPSSSPVTYSAAGVQYVAIVAGGGGPLDAGGGFLTPEITNPTGSTTLWVFKLNSATPKGQ